MGEMINIKNVYLLGIGGIGMSALARYFRKAGAAVSGYDKTPTPLTDELIREGMKIHFEENPELIPANPDLVIYTPAIPADHKELIYLKKQGFLLKKRSEVLGMITKGTKTIAVAGTHGKTTTSTLIAHILYHAGWKMTAFLGGISKNYGTNFIQTGVPDYFVVEADEYDRSFLQLNPYISVITSVDADHLDIYHNLEALKKSFADFTSQIEEGGHLILKKNVKLSLTLRKDVSQSSYSVDRGSDYHAEHIRKEGGLFTFDFHSPEGVIRDITPGLPGTFNLENAIAASAVAKILGIDDEDLKESLESYVGVKRRFDLQVQRDDFVYIDDYAHHPEELKACITAVKEIFPGKMVTGVFQPHLYSRTKDLSAAFAKSLDLLDRVILLDIYPARELPIEGVTSSLILDQIRNPRKMICSRESLLDKLQQLKPEVLLTIGAGDIDQLVLPIKELFAKKREPK
jgi:UDP-N-acetylmuramate--alanine ligase